MVGHTEWHIGSYNNKTDSFIQQHISGHCLEEGRLTLALTRLALASTATVSTFHPLTRPLHTRHRKCIWPRRKRLG